MEAGFYRVGEVANISSKGINAKFIRTGATYLESEKYICVRDENEKGEGQLTIIEMEKGMAINRKPNKSEAAIMHQKENIIALRAAGESGPIIQIFNFDTKTKIKTCEFRENVVFWKWINLAKLAVVTTASVYFIDITREGD
jgi:clathrin heavy chain